MAASGDMAEGEGTGPAMGAGGAAAVRAAVEAAKPVDMPDEDGGGGSRETSGDSGSLNLRCARFPKNDIGNARRLIARFGDDLLYVQDIGWYLWTGANWDAERGEIEAQLRTHRVAAWIRKEAEALKKEGPRPAEKEDDFRARVEQARKETTAALQKAGPLPGETEGDFKARVEQMAALAVAPIEEKGPRPEEKGGEFNARVWEQREWGVTSGFSARLNAMLREAVPYKAVQPEALDRDHMAFNVQNGTLRLAATKKRVKDLECPDPDAVRWIETTTGSVRLEKHRRTDRISKISPIGYNSKAKAEVFGGFLERILPDPEVRAFLQRYFGYGLTGDTSEQCLVLLHGEGANGKSTLIDIVTWIMGDYATALPFASLLHDDKRRGSEATPDIARLPGARLVSASEPEIGQRFSESLLKSLTGGEVMTARHLNKGFFEFMPSFKLVLSFNHKPSVRGQDEGIWRRLLMVPFEVKIPEPERDRFLKDKLRKEAPGILNWLLAGAKQWLEIGLAVPDKVRAATADYRSESDPVGQFMASATWYEAGSTVQASKLYKAYTSWCHDSAVTPLSQTAFGKTLGDRGFKKSRQGTYFYQDLRLDDRYSPASEAGGGDPDGGYGGGYGGDDGPGGDL